MNPVNPHHRIAAADPTPGSDPEEFVAQYRKAYPKLAQLAAAIIGDRAQAEDIVQEASIIAIKKLDTFQPGTNLSAWLAEIVRRCSFNYRRKTLNRKTYAADPTSLGRLAQDGAASPESWPIRRETGELLADQSSFDDEVLQALSTLSDDARCCLLLRTVQKLSYAEISQLMQIPEGTAMSHVHRSKAAMRNALGKFGHQKSAEDHSK